MKIAFVGKGGSGKTTLASLLSRHLAGQGRKVLAIDADINQHLALALGMDEGTAKTVPALGNELPRIKEVLRGTNVRIASSKDMVKTTPAGNGSHLLRLAPLDPLIETLSKTIEGVHVMATGGFQEEDLGVKCFHAKTGAVELILNHLVDAKDEFVVVDMTAGADAFASGLFTKFDMTFVVVEPTPASLGVYRQYAEYALRFDIPLAVIGNKVMDAEDESFLQKYVGKELVALIPFSKSIRQGEQDADSVLKQLEEYLILVPKDWGRFYRQAVEFHLKNATSWANASVGKDLSTQIDPEFGPGNFV